MTILKIPKILPLKKPRVFFFYVCVFLAAGGTGCFIRLYPLRHHVSNTAWEKASLLIMSSAMRSIRSNINTQTAGGIPPDQKDIIASEHLNAAISQDKKKVRQAILGMAKSLDRLNPPEQKFPYLLASDSYYFYDLTRTVLETGRLSPRIRGSKYFHPKMTAPAGYWEPLTLHPYTGALTHRAVSIFNPDADLMFSVSVTPLILFLLTLLAFLALAHTLSLSRWTILITACWLGCVQIFLKRSTFAWYDNDAYNVLFPILLITIMSFGLSSTSRRGKLFSSASLALTLILYSLFWQGWMFMAVILLVFGGAVIGLQWKEWNKHYFQELLLTVSVFLGIFLTGMGLLMGWRDIIILFQEGWSALSGFLNAGISVWPDTYIAVGELKKSSLTDIIDLTGGKIFFTLSLVGILSGLIPFLKEKKAGKSQKIILLSTVFALAGFIITLGAQRFALLCVTPIAVLCLYGIDTLIKGITALSAKLQPPVSIWLKRTAPALLAAALIIPLAIRTDASMPGLMDPIFNDTWHAALTEIRDTTPAGTIVYSWWPPGHFIKAIAQRPVTFDGASINDRQGYWLSLAFLSKTEEEALNYFRLLNNGANEAVDLLTHSRMTDARAAAFLKTLIHLPKAEALALAQKSLSHETAQHLISLTHTQADQASLLLYNDMVQNFLLVPFVARWDMQKAEEINQSPILKINIPAPGSPEHMTFLWSLAGGYPRISPIMSPAAENNGLLIFPNHMVIDLNQKMCRIDSAQYGNGLPAFLFYKEGNRVIKKPLPGANLNYSVVIAQRHDKYEAMLLETPLAESLLIRLYFFGDTGLQHIKQTSRHASLTRQIQIDVFDIQVKK